MRRSLLLALSLALALPSAGLVLPVSPAEAYQRCGSDHYRDSRGHCVRRPTRSGSAPSGASARCRDGTYSFSHSRRGTCSRHGGVARWL